MSRNRKSRQSQAASFHNRDEQRAKVRRKRAMKQRDDRRRSSERGWK